MTRTRNARQQPSSHTRYGPTYNGTQDFVCLHCGLYIAFHPQIAGVQNRNHCPYCLWSRHVDWCTSAIGSRTAGPVCGR
ncbi:RNHCP domain-containing protein [Candidatus Gracilibacteria bacterium]|nr:RNHCP domain-containing protein [Candidatus Gracilibacteria bacterium]